MPREAGLFVGQKGEAAFTEPFIDYRWSANELPKFIQRLYAAGDDRSFVVFSLVLIEKYLDALLEGIAPGYQTLKDNRDFTVSLKIELLKALRLVPPHILRAADLVRKSRNEFAHEELERLEQLSPRLRDPIVNLVRQTLGNLPSYFSSGRETFRALIFVALAGLRAYRPNFLILREKLEEGALIDELKQECHKRFMEGIELKKNRKPLRVEEKEGWRYTYYEDGLVSIVVVDSNNPPNTPAAIPQGVSRVVFGE